MWRLIKMPNFYTVWFSGKIIAFQTPQVTFCFVVTEWSEQTSSEGASWSRHFNKMDLLLPFNKWGHNSPWWGWLSIAFQIEPEIKPILIFCSPPPPPRVLLHICQAAQTVTHQVTAWSLVSWGLIGSYDIRSDCYLLQRSKQSALEVLSYS